MPQDIHWDDIQRALRKMPSGPEEFARILFVVDYDDNVRREAYALGERRFKILLLTSVGNAKCGDRVYIGKHKSKRIAGLTVKRRIKVQDLPDAASQRLESTVKEIVKASKDTFFRMVETFFLKAHKYPSSGTAESRYAPWDKRRQYAPSQKLPHIHPLNRLGFSERVVCTVVRGARQGRFRSMKDVFRSVPDVTPEKLVSGICRWIGEELQPDFPKHRSRLFVSP